MSDEVNQGNVFSVVSIIVALVLVFGLWGTFVVVGQ